MNINLSRRAHVKSPIIKKQTKSSRYMSIPMKMVSVAVLHGLMTPRSIQQVVPLISRGPKRATQIQPSMGMSGKSTRPLAATRPTQIQPSMGMSGKSTRPLAATRPTQMRQPIAHTMPLSQPLHVIKVEVSVAARTSTDTRPSTSNNRSRKDMHPACIPDKNTSNSISRKDMHSFRGIDQTNESKKTRKGLLAAGTKKPSIKATNNTVTKTKKATIQPPPKPKTSQPPRVLPRIEKRVSRVKASPLASKHASIYVLELEGGFIYVGKSKNVEHRISQHMNKRGAVFTRMHHPTGKILRREGSLEGDGDGPERDETLRQMYKHGPRKVRGWKYCNRSISSAELKDIESNIREMLDLCRICGGAGHFASQCKRKRKFR
jgi:hypothetical protein